MQLNGWHFLTLLAVLLAGMILGTMKPGWTRTATLGLVKAA